MAKSNKQQQDQGGGDAAPAKKTAAKKEPAAKKETAAKAEPPAKKTAATGAAGSGAKKSAKSGKSGASGGPQHAPLIDTGLAAQTAAAMVANRLAAAAGGATPAQSRPESASFKNLKDSLNKPAAGSLGGILGTAGGSKKFAPGFNNPKHGGGPTGGGRNQTFGADVNRAGVPRRTGGG